MNEATIITFNYPTNIENINVFEIGNNKPYFNKGKEEYILKEKILPALKNLTNLNKSTPINILLSGRVLDWVNENSKKTIQNLQEFLKKPNVNLISSTHYNSSLHLLTDEEFENQIKQYNTKIKNLFDKKINTFLSFDNNINESQLKILKSYKINKCILLPNNETGKFNFKSHSNVISCSSKTSQKGKLLHINYEDLSKFDFNETIPLNKLFKKSIFKHRPKRENPFKEHVKDELITLYSLVREINQKELQQDWRLLSSNINILNEKNNYEDYISYMNILNDVCYKIKTIQLLQQGKEITKPVLTNDPTKQLKEVLVNI